MRTTTLRSSISSFGPFCSNGSEPRSKEPRSISKSFWFDSADSFLFPDGSVFDWKVVRVLMVVGLSSPLSKSSFIYLFLVFLHPKSSIGLKLRVGFFECVFFIYQQPQT